MEDGLWIDKLMNNTIIENKLLSELNLVYIYIYIIYNNIFSITVNEIILPFLII